MERRKHPRLEQQLNLRLAADGYGFSTVTHNVSCVGCYCHVDTYIPPFTKILVRLSLPINKRRVYRKEEVACKGVVVRTDDEQNGGFNIAIFFNDIKRTQRDKISQYIHQFLS